MLHLADEAARTGADAVVRLGDPHEHRRHLPDPQRLVELLRLRHRRPPVDLARDEHRRRRHVRDVVDRRALHVVLEVVPRRAREPVVHAARTAHVRRKDPAVPVDDGLLRRGGGEAVRVRHDPGRQHPAAGSSGHEELLFIDVSARNHFIDARHQVVEVVARIGVVDLVPEVLAIAGAPARVRVEDDVARRGEQLDFRAEAVPVVGERAAVDLEQERILAARVEVRRLHDPALDVEPVMRGLVPDLLRLPDRLLREEILVQVREALPVAAPVRDREVRGVVRRPVGEGETVVPGGGEGAASIGTTDRQALNAGDDIRHGPVEVDVGESRVPLGVVLEEQPPSVARPVQVPDRAVEVVGDEARAGPVPAHHVQLRYLVPQESVIVARVGDHATVGRHRRTRVGPAPVGQLPHRAVRHGELEDLGVPHVLPVVAPGGRDQQVLRIGRPLGRPAVVVGAVRDLPGRPPLGGKDEDVGVSDRQEALAVRPVIEPLVRRGGGRPRRAFRLRGHLREGRRRVRDEHAEGDRAPVGRPGQPARASLQLREQGRLSGVHPAQVELRLPVFVACDVEEPRAVRRPARRREVLLSGEERTVVRTVVIDDPQVASLTVRHDVHRGPHIDDPGTVGRDPGIAGDFEFEDVRRAEVVRIPLLPGERCGGDEDGERERGG